MSSFFMSIINAIISKKKIIAYVSAILIAVAAAILGMKPAEVKDAIVSGPSIELPSISVPAVDTAQAPKK